MENKELQEMFEELEGACFGMGQVLAMLLTVAPNKDLLRNMVKDLEDGLEVICMTSQLTGPARQAALVTFQRLTAPLR